MPLLILLGLDVLLVAATLTAYLSRPRIGGELAKGLKIVLAGILVLGLAPGFETLRVVLFNQDMVSNEIIHRLVAVLAYCFIIGGLVLMRRAFED